MLTTATLFYPSGYKQTQNNDRPGERWIILNRKNKDDMASRPLDCKHKKQMIPTALPFPRPTFLNLSNRCRAKEIVMGKKLLGSNS